MKHAWIVCPIIIVAILSMWLYNAHHQYVVQHDALTNTLTVRNGVEASYREFCPHIAEEGMEAVIQNLVTSIEAQGYTVTPELHTFIVNTLSTCVEAGQP